MLTGHCLQSLYSLNEKACCHQEQSVQLAPLFNEQTPPGLTTRSTGRRWPSPLVSWPYALVEVPRKPLPSLQKNPSSSSPLMVLYETIINTHILCVSMVQGDRWKLPSQHLPLELHLLFGKTLLKTFKIKAIVITVLIACSSVPSPG